MATIDPMLDELRHEAAQTRKAIERVPDARLEYKPHPKSMSLGTLAGHLAEIPAWTPMMTGSDEFNLVTAEYKPTVFKSRAEILKKFDENIAAALKAMRELPDAKWGETWTFKVDGKEVFRMPKIAVIRGMVLNHLIHHRGQLTVYLRLNDIPVPALYGPSADEQG